MYKGVLFIVTTGIILSMLAIFPFAFAHTAVEVESYKIEVGWKTEPPVVGIRNDLVLKITETGETACIF